jgi:UDP-2,3-diacylglucosamine pyrophosphatase LpxH
VILAVSDLHLGIDQDDPRERRFENFLIYLKENLFGEGGDLVLLGDIFDFWMRDLSDVLLQSGDVIEHFKGKAPVLGADAEDWFVFGHTHIPFLDG